jgi:hypothetical protein
VLLEDVHLGARRLMGADTLMVGGWGTAKCFEADVLLYSGGMDRDEVCGRQSRQVRRTSKLRRCASASRIADLSSLIDHTI